jgi:hypothetical protein
MKNKKSLPEKINNQNFQANDIDVVFDVVNPVNDVVKNHLMELQNKMGIKIQSVYLPKNFKLGLKDKERFNDWLSIKIQNEFSAHSVLFNKNNIVGQIEDWQKNKFKNKRFLETKNLYARDSIFNKKIF